MGGYLVEEKHIQVRITYTRYNSVHLN